MEQREDKFLCRQTEMEAQNITFELNGELSMPDYLGEISRLLRVWPRVMPPRRFISGGKAEFSGRVCYDVLYAGADGKLHHTDMEDTYSFSVPCQGEGVYPFAFLVPDVVVGRVTAPRRLTVRCRMHAQVGTYQQTVSGVALSPEEQEKVCLLGDTAEAGRYCSEISDEIELQESFEVQEADLAVISARGEIFLPDVVALHDGVRCRGEAVVTLLCCEAGDENGDKLPFAVTRSLPFSIDVPVQGVCSEDEARATGVVEALRATVEGNRVSLSLGARLQLEVAGRETTCYIKDLFMPYTKTECRTVSHRNWVPTLCKNQNYSLVATPTVGEAGLPSGATVIDACADAEVAEKAVKDGQISVRGDVHCHLLYVANGEFGVAEVKIPFGVMLNGSFETLSVLATVPLCRVQQEGDRLRITPELMLACMGGAHVCFSSVEEAHFLPEERERDCDLEFYYPAKNDTLWEIARRLAVSPEELASVNGLDAALSDVPQTPSESGYLMLP